MGIGDSAKKRAKQTKVGRAAAFTADLARFAVSRGPKYDVTTEMAGVQKVGRGEARGRGTDPNDRHIDRIREVCRDAKRRPEKGCFKHLFGQVDARYDPLFQGEVRVASKRRDDLTGLSSSMQSYGMKVEIKSLTGGKKDKVQHYYLAVDIASCLRPSL